MSIKTDMEPHPLAGKTVSLKEPFTDHMGNVHTTFRVEDWWLRLTGRTWTVSAAEGNLAALNFMTRTTVDDFTDHDAVVYGKTGNYGNLFNVEQLGEVVTDNG